MSVSGAMVYDAAIPDSGELRVMSPSSLKVPSAQTSATTLTAVPPQPPLEGASAPGPALELPSVAPVGPTHQPSAHQLPAQQPVKRPSMEESGMLNSLGTPNRNSLYLAPPGCSLPLVLLVPHGGSKKGSIPRRKKRYQGRPQALCKDEMTVELALALRDALEHQSNGLAPHLVVCELSRESVDVNRPLSDAAQGHPMAEAAWTEYHA